MTSGEFRISIRDRNGNSYYTPRFPLDGSRLVLQTIAICNPKPSLFRTLKIGLFCNSGLGMLAFAKTKKFKIVKTGDRAAAQETRIYRLRCERIH